MERTEIGGGKASLVVDTVTQVRNAVRGKKGKVFFFSSFHLLYLFLDI